MADPQKVDEHHLTHLLTERAPQLRETKRLEASNKKLNGQISEALLAAGVKRHQMMTGPFAGTLVYIVEPDPRKTIVAEKLLALGVSPDIIKAATSESPVASYSRADAPKSPTDKPAFDPGNAESEPAVADDSRPN